MFKRILEAITDWATENLGKLFTLLRIVKPITVIGGTAIVTRFDDVEEILSRDDVFHVPYAEKMGVVTNGSNFFLGMQNTAIYQRDVSNMRIVARREDVEKIVIPSVSAEVQKIVTDSNGQLDFVKDLSSLIPTRMVAHYFGTPGPSEAEITAWATLLFEYLFFDFDNDTELAKKAEEASASLRNYLDQLILERKDSEAVDDLLGRCLVMQQAGLPGMADEEIRNNLIGLIIGAIPTLNKAAAQIMDELFNRPKELQGAQRAASDNNDALLMNYALEAFRFRPLASGILRIAAEDYVVARGTMRSTRIPKGTKVVPATESAMCDRRKVRKPEEFRTDRKDYEYMLFGYGLHRCFGFYINRAVLPLMIKSLLQQTNLARVAGEGGKLKMNGQWPESMLLQF